MRRFACAAALGGAVLLSAACGTHEPPRVAPGAVNVPVRESLDAYIARVRKLSMEASRPAPAPTPTLEGQDGELRNALAWLKRTPTASAHRRVANAYRAAGILDLAYDHYDTARRLDDRDAAAYDGLARIWRDWGLPQVGLSDARRALYFAPRSAVIHNTLGTLLDALGQHREARRAFERAAALDPQAGYAWNNLCYRAFEDGDLTAAATSCRTALALAPSLVPARNNLALVHAASGRFDRAEEDLAAVGNAAVQQYNAGIVYSAARRYADASRAFAEAERLRPGWTVAAERARQAERLARIAAVLEGE